MTITLPPDSEGLLRTRLRASTDLRALVGQRIFFGAPKGSLETARKTSFPMIVITRAGGALDPTVAEMDNALIQFDVWGSLDDSGNGLKADCTTVVNTLRAVLAAMDANEESCVWLPDPDTDRPRYVVTAEVTAITT